MTAISEGVLRDAICMLALITNRPPDVNELLSRIGRNGGENDGDISTSEGLSNTKSFTAKPDADIAFEDSAADLEDMDVEEDLDQQLSLTALQDRVLDRLAETLARFKSDPRRTRGPPIDPKHVSSTMMIVYHPPASVKFLCAKNEGLDQGETSEDTKFLDSWRKCMECISKTGAAEEESKATLFSLVTNYQRPRINHYLKILQDAFTIKKDSKSRYKGATLSESWLQKLLSVSSLSWVDDNGNKFTIPVSSSSNVAAESEATMTGDSLRNVKDEIDAVFDKVETFCQFNGSDDAEFTTLQLSLLKELMAAILGCWKSVRHQSAIKTRLRNQFQDVQQGPRLQKAVITALTFLCRVHLGIITFIDAAERMPMFQSIECVPIKVPPRQSQRDLSPETPLRVAKSLGIKVTDDGWIQYLQKPETKEYFHSLRRVKRDVHAELQIIMKMLQNLFWKSYPLTNAELLAQSSAALSTAQTVTDQELGQMEKSQLDIRQMMMMPTVMNGGLLVINILKKPGFAYVIGGTLGKGQEMSLEEAELYKENHIRSKFGLERRGELPLKRILAQRICRHCGRPSSLRCAACRMSYCSVSCQRKDWRRHVFVCAVRNRPDNFDRLQIILSQRHCLSQDGAARSQLLADLFADDHLSRAFGFVDCYDCSEIANLICIYSQLTYMYKSASHRRLLSAGNLGKFIEAWANFHVSNNGVSSDCHYIPWFLERRATGLEIPNWEGEYMYQVLGVLDAEHILSLRPAAENPALLSPAEGAVFSLYTQLCRQFNNIPGIYTSEWTDFGFCFCRNSEQSQSLATLYLELAKSGASLGEIADAWKKSSLAQLMKARGINFSFFEANGIRFHRPDADEFGIYRLMAEVSHATSGRFCDCFRPKGHCHPKHETHLSLESDLEYGFHGTNSWERWQLLNFYNHVFRHPSFNACEMQQAKRNADQEILERYLDSLVPDFRLKMLNMCLADGMFPKLRGRAQFSNGRPHCYCVAHKMFGSKGLDWMVSRRIQNSLIQPE